MGNQCGGCGAQEEEGDLAVASYDHKKNQDYTDQELKSVLKIQSNLRGIQARKNIRQGAWIKDKMIEDDNLEYQQEIIEADGTLYTGQTKKGEKTKQGYGHQVWPDGAHYEGIWKDGMQHGHGKYYHRDGDVYEGEWKDNKADGYGVYKHANGSVYEGEWVEDNQEGFGREEWADSSHYSGNYIKSTKQGYGHYYWQDGNTYMGNWNQNSIDGHGIFLWADQRIYSGDWRNGKIHGVGSYLYADNRFYHGEYQNDKRQGYGCYIYGDGRAYLGQWENGKQNGDGHLVLPNGVIRKGTWTNGQKGDLTECQEDEQETILNKLKETKSLQDQLADEVLKAKAEMRNLKLQKLKSYTKEKAMQEERQDQPTFTEITDRSHGVQQNSHHQNGNQIAPEQYQ